MNIALPDRGWKNIFQLIDSSQSKKICLIKVLSLVLILSVVATERVDHGFSFVENDCPQNQEALTVHTDFTSHIVKDGKELFSIQYSHIIS